MGSPKKKKKRFYKSWWGQVHKSYEIDEKIHSYAGVNYLTKLLETCPSRLA